MKKVNRFVADQYDEDGEPVVNGFLEFPLGRGDGRPWGSDQYLTPTPLFVAQEVSDDPDDDDVDLGDMPDSDDEDRFLKPPKLFTPKQR
jgi:hypothetical protein